MAIVLNDDDVDCFVLDGDSAVIILNKEKYILDYSTLMELLTRLAVSASLMEDSNLQQPQKTKEFRNEYH
jgi:hypothetical protein